MDKKIVNMLKLVAWVHEIFHWIPAKLMTTNVKAHSDHVEYDLQDDQWKNVLIVSSPLIVGLMLLGVVTWGVSKKRLDKGWIQAAGLFVGTSIWDIKDLVYFARHKKWRYDAKRRF